MQPSEFRKIKDKPVRAFYITRKPGSRPRSIALVFDTHVIEFAGKDLTINVHKLTGLSGGATFTTS